MIMSGLWKSKFGGWRILRQSRRILQQFILYWGLRVGSRNIKNKGDLIDVSMRKFSNFRIYMVRVSQWMAPHADQDDVEENLENRQMNI